MTEWYYADRQGQQRGPVSAQELLALRNAGQVGMETLVWRNGMSNWQTFSTMANELLPPSPPEASPMQGMSMYEMAAPLPGAPSTAASDTTAPAQAAPAATAAPGSYSMYETATPNDARASDPYSAPRAAIGNGQFVAVQGGHVVYAGFWKRVAATIIDMFAIGIPLGIVMAIIGAIFGINSSLGMRGTGAFDHPLFSAISYLITASVYGWFYSNASLKATPGKLAIGIKVVRSDGEALTFLRGFARYWATFPGALIFGIGFMMAGFTARKQALHDMICDTVVVDKWAFTEHPEWQDETLGTVTKIVLVLGIVLFALACLAMCTMIAALVHSRG